MLCVLASASIFTSSILLVVVVSLMQRSATSASASMIRSPSMSAWEACGPISVSTVNCKCCLRWLLSVTQTWVSVPVEAAQLPMK